MSTKSLITVPALITLGVTLLRLVGELQDWSPRFFSREAGGAGAIMGIAWLPPIFGIYFALRLAKTGLARAGRAIGFSLLGIVALIALGYPTVLLFEKDFRLSFLLSIVAAIVPVMISYRGWPDLGKAMVAYGLAARVPVVVVMFFAIMGNWGTHYDAPAPNLPPMQPLAEFFWTGLIPQLTFWIAYTVLLGMLFGGIALALSGRRHVAAETTT